MQLNTFWIKYFTNDDECISLFFPLCTNSWCLNIPHCIVTDLLKAYSKDNMFTIKHCDANLFLLIFFVFHLLTNNLVTHSRKVLSQIRVKNLSGFLFTLFLSRDTCRLRCLYQSPYFKTFMESISRKRFRQPTVAWRAVTTTLFLLGS
jgi:hypothetical protein